MAPAMLQQRVEETFGLPGSRPRCDEGGTRGLPRQPVEGALLVEVRGEGQFERLKPGILSRSLSERHP